MPIWNGAKTMALNIAMNSEAAVPQTSPKAAAATEDNHRSRLEVILACAGILAWLFSAYEGLLAVLK